MFQRNHIVSDLDFQITLSIKSFLLSTPKIFYFSESSKMFQWSKEHFLANICQSQCKRPFRKITQPDTLLKQGLFTCIIRYIHFKGTLFTLFDYFNLSLGQPTTKSSMFIQNLFYFDVYKKDSKELQKSKWEWLQSRCILMDQTLLRSISCKHICLQLPLPS